MLLVTATTTSQAVLAAMPAGTTRPGAPVRPGADQNRHAARRLTAPFASNGVIITV